VLGANTVPETSEAAGRNYVLTNHLRRSGLWPAAVSGGLLALGAVYLSRRMWSRPSRTFLGLLLRRRPRRTWGFAR
jgi:hypothetical protein